MATVGQLISMVDSMYPNVASVEEKINYMNIAQDELSPYFGYIVEDTSLVTVEDQDSYAYPDGVKDVSNIIALAIGRSETPTSRYDYNQYKLNKSEDEPMSQYGFYQIVNSNGDKKFVVYPVPQFDDYPIVIRYRKQLTSLSANLLGFEPEFDSRYHVMLAFYCCHMICVKSASPDVEQANMFMDKYDSSFQSLWKTHAEEQKKRNEKRKDNKQWHKSKSFHSGW